MISHLYIWIDKFDQKFIILFYFQKRKEKEKRKIPKEGSENSRRRIGRKACRECRVADVVLYIKYILILNNIYIYFLLLCNKLWNLRTTFSSFFLSPLSVGFRFHCIPEMNFVGDRDSESEILSIHWLHESGFFLHFVLSLLFFFFFFLPDFAAATCTFLFSVLRLCELLYLFDVFVYNMCRLFFLISLEHISFGLWSLWELFWFSTIKFSMFLWNSLNLACSA